MPPMPPTKSKSHKKKRRLASDIKIENATAAKNARIDKPSRDGCTGNDSTVAMPTPTRQKQNDRFYKVAGARLNLSFHSYNPINEIHTNMIPYISKEINGNFNLKYKRRSSTNRRSLRTQTLDNNKLVLSNNESPSLRTQTLDNNKLVVSNNESPFSNNIVLDNFRRCYVEDYMTTTITEQLLVMVPTHHHLDESSKWYDLTNSDINNTTLEYTHEKFIGYIGVVVTNPMRAQVISGMHLRDYEVGFGNHNYGCTIDFSSNTHTHSVLLTWNEVLQGRKNGIQVWRSGTTYRDVFSNFADRSKTSHGLTALFNSLYDEVYGDRLQSLHLISCFNRATIKSQNKALREYEVMVSDNKPIILEGDVYNDLLEKCNNAFGSAIKKCYTDFVVIGQPIINRTKVDEMVCLYKHTMSHHYNVMFTMLGYNKKTGLTMNKHLCETGYYDRQVFYNFLAMSRQKNPKKMMNWAILSAGANYGRGLGDMVNRRSTYLGASSTIRSYIRTIKPYAETMLSNISNKLSHCQKTVWTLDNNQKGHPLKFQRFGSSNRFVKVTGRTARYCILCEDNLGEENSKRVPITYIDQRIMNPINFPIFEKEIDSMDEMNKVQECLLRSMNYNGEAVKLDLTGGRVEIYNNMVELSNTIKSVVLPYLTGYNLRTKKYKQWRHQPVEHGRTQRNEIVIQCHSETTILREITMFQEKIVHQWNPESIKATALIIPPVSLRDEIKTNGYGMAIIEILCLSGLLIHRVSEPGVEPSVESWDLCNDWDIRQVYLCMDGLSLDRHRSFQRKLINLPYSYDKVFKQSLIFQKALTRVVDVSGPLHIAFHMLQSIYIIYRDMLKWAQSVVCWKKVNITKVSESFDLCRQLCMLTLQESERLAIDLFLVEKEDELLLVNSNANDTNVGLTIATMYNEYIHDMNSVDDCRLYMKGFIIMATQFRNYWQAVRLGDRVTMECIQNKWIGVHLMSGKHKCVENYLNAIELEYKTIDNTALQEIRMNISVRYHEGKDKAGNPFPLHPLDEVQENINQWTKRILMGPDEVSWVSHSPNVASAHMCINFEESEFVKSQLDFSDDPKRKTSHRSTKVISPKKTREQERLYEFIIAMFKDEISGRKCFPKDANEIIINLTTTLVKESIPKDTDALQDCITSMFGETEELENTELCIHDDYTGIPDANTDATTQSIDTSNTSNTEYNNGTKRTVTQISLENVFIQGRKKMIEMKIPEVRLRKQSRILRSRAFFLEVNSTVTETEEKLELELDRVTNIQLFNPWYRTAFRLICN